VSAPSSGIPIGTLARVERWGIAVAVAAVSLSAWLLLLDEEISSAPSHLLGHHGLLPAASMWWAMALAMMLPASIPSFLVLARFARTRTTVAGWDAALPAPLGGALLAGAGLFQLTSLKNACLERCRNPLSFFLTHWNEGRWGGVVMGLRHGADCLGCCWALMATAFALGVMNLLWMAVLTLVALVEKLAPRGALLGRAFGVVLIAWGAFVAFR
jgi:predicted metal-binding membrane protein